MAKTIFDTRTNRITPLPSLSQIKAKDLIKTELKPLTGKITPVEDLNFWEKFDRKVSGFLPRGLSRQEAKRVNAQGVQDVDDVRTDIFKKEYQKKLGDPRYDHFAESFAKQRNEIVRDFGDLDGKALADRIDTRKDEIMKGRSYGGDTGRFSPDPISTQHNHNSAFQSAKMEVLDEYERELLQTDPSIGMTTKLGIAFEDYRKIQAEEVYQIVEEWGQVGSTFIFAKEHQEELAKASGRAVFSITSVGEGIAKLGKFGADALDWEAGSKFFQRIDADFDTLQDIVLNESILKEDKSVPYSEIPSFVGEYMIPYGAAENITIKALANVAPRMVLAYPALTGMFAGFVSAVPVTGAFSMSKNVDSEEARQELFFDAYTAIFSIFGMKQFIKRIRAVGKATEFAVYDTLEMAKRISDDTFLKTIDDFKKLKIGSETAFEKVKKVQDDLVKRAKDYEVKYDRDTFGSLGGKLKVTKKDPLIEEAKKFKTAEEFVDSIPSKKIIESETGLSGTKIGVVDKEGVGTSINFTDGKTTVQTAIRETNDQVILTSISTKEAGDLTKLAKKTGRGSAVVNSLKKYADITGKQLVVPDVTKPAVSFWKKFGFLDEGGVAIPFNGKKQVVGQTFFYNPKSQITDIFNKAKADEVITIRGKVADEPSLSDTIIRPIESKAKIEIKKAQPTRGIDEVKYEDDIFQYVAKKMEDMGDKKSADSIALSFRRLLSEKRVDGIDDFLQKAEKNLELKKQKILADTEKANLAESGSQIVDPEIRADLDGIISRGPIKLAREAGWKGKTAKDALDFIEGKDSTMIKGLDERLGYDPDVAGGTVDIEDAWEYIKQGLIDKVYPKKVSREISPKQLIFERQLVQKQVSSFNRGYRVGSRTAKQDLEAIKKEIARYARENIPNFEARKSEFTKIMTRIAKAKGLNDIDEAFKLVDEVVTNATKRKLVGDIEKSLKNISAKKVKGILKGKFGADTQKVLDEIKLTVKSKSRAESQQEIFEILEQSEKTGLLTPEMSQRIEILQMAEPKFQDIKQLKRTLDTIKEIKSNGRSNFMAKIEKRQKKNKDNARRAVNSLSGGKKLKTIELGKDVEKEGLAKIEEVIDNFDTYQQGWTTMWEKFSKFSKTGESITERLLTDPLHEIFSNPVNRARQEQNMGTMEAIKTFQNNFSEIYEVKAGSGEFRKKWAEQTKKIIIRKKGYKNANGKVMNEDFILTRAEIIHANGMMRDPLILKDLMVNNKLTPETLTAIKKNMKTEDIKWLNFQMEFYRDYYPGINKVYREMFGVDLPFSENYITISRTAEKDIPETNLLANQAKTYSSMINGSLKGRVKNAVPLKFMDANDVFFRHVTQMEHFKAFSEPVKNIRSVMGNADFREAMRQYHGKYALKYADKFIEDIARDGIDSAFAMKFIDKLRVNFVKSKIGVNPMTFFKQLTSIPAYWAETPIVEWNKGMAHFWTNPSKHWKELYENSTMLQARYKIGFERDLKLAQGQMGKPVSGLSRLTNAGMYPTKIGDRIAIELGGYPMYRAKYKKYKKTMSDADAKAKAIIDFEGATLRAQQASDIESLSGLQRSGSWGKSLTMFKTAPNQYYREASMALRNLKHKRGNRKENVKQFLIYWVVLPQLFQLTSDVVIQRDQINKGHQTRALMIGPLNGVMVAGDLISSLAGWVTGEHDFDYDISPLLSISRDTKFEIQRLKKLGKNWDDEIEMEDIYKATKGLADIAGSLSGVPTPSVFRMGEGVYDLSTGKTKDYRRLVASKYALGSAKDKLKKELLEGDLEKARGFYDQAKKAGDINVDFQRYFRDKVRDEWAIPATGGKKLDNLSEDDKKEIRRALTKLQSDKGDQWVKLFVSSYKQKNTREAYSELSKLPLEPEKRNRFLPKIKKEKSEAKTKIQELFKKMDRDEQKTKIKQLIDKGYDQEKIRSILWES